MNPSFTRRLVSTISAVGCVAAVVGCAPDPNPSPAEEDTVTSVTSTAADNSEKPTSSATATKTYQPGTVTTDKFGRRLVIPKNPGGDKLSDKVVNPKDMCSEKEQKRIPKNMELQKIGDAGAVFSSSDGPTKTDGDVPDGYSRTVAGAILTITNYANFTNKGGKYGDAAERRFGGLSEQEKKNLNPSKVHDEEFALAAMFPGGHRVVTCSKDIVVVQLAFPSFEDSTGFHETPVWAYGVIPMVWHGDHWEIDKQSPLGDLSGAPIHIGESLDDSWVKWTL